MIDNEYIIQLRHLMVEAMKAKDTKRCNIYKNIISELQKALTSEEPIDPDNESCHRFVNKLYNDRKKDAKLAMKAGRQDIVDENLYEAEVIASILPIFPTKEKIKEYVESLGIELTKKNMSTIINKTKEHYVSYDNDELRETILSIING